MKEYEKKLDDGGVLKGKLTTTKFIKPIIKITIVDGMKKKTLLREEPVGTEILEQILQLPPGITEPYSKDLKSKTTENDSSENLPDGTLAKKKVIKTVVFPPGQLVTSKRIEGDIDYRSEVTEDTKHLPDGKTQKSKTITTKHVKPVTEITYIGGTPTDTKEHEEIVGGDIEDNILELPCGLIKPSARNCDVKITVDESQATLPDGTPAGKAVTKMLCLQKPMAKLEKQENIVEGPIEYRTEVKKSEEKLRDGRTVRCKTTTITHVNPLRKITTIGGLETSKLLREEVVAVDIVENILELPWGVTEPIGKHTTADTKFSSGEEILPSGLVAKKKTFRTVVTLKDARSKFF